MIWFANYINLVIASRITIQYEGMEDPGLKYVSNTGPASPLPAFYFHWNTGEAPVTGRSNNTPYGTRWDPAWYDQLPDGLSMQDAYIYKFQKYVDKK